MIATTPTPQRQPVADQFSQREIIGTVRSFREFNGGFTLVDLTNGQTVTGEMETGDVLIGSTYRFLGCWVDHPKYGMQFNVDSVLAAWEANERGVINYLARGGCGLSTGEAKRAWSMYGVEAIPNLRDNPEMVASECGIDFSKCAKASSIIIRQERDAAPTIELFELFAGRGYPRKAVKTCIREWGERAPSIIRRDPFKMVTSEIPGVGFKRADALYIDLGGDPGRLKRAMLAGWHWMRNVGTGSTWEPREKVEAAICQAVGMCDTAKAITLGVRSGWFRLKVEGSLTWISEADNAKNEETIARHIKRIAAHKPIWNAELDSALSDHQRQQLAGIVYSPIAVLAGTPGTGKTYSAAAMIRGLIAAAQSPPRILVCAPTGKAAVRITEAMQRYSLPLQALTIHTTLEVCGHSSGKPEFARDHTNPLDADLVIVDETSMMDTDLAAALFSAIPDRCNVLLVGDPYQLPPVGHGAPLRDLIAAGTPTALLTEIQRNAGAIVTACSKIKDGQLFDTAENRNGGNLVIARADDAEQQLATVDAILAGCLANGFDPAWDVQVLVPRNEGPLGRKPLNVAMQRRLNPEMETDAKRRHPQWRKGDKVICLKNTSRSPCELRDGCDSEGVENYVAKPAVSVYVANGDMGEVMATEPGGAVVRFVSPERVVKVQSKKRRKAAATAEGDEANDGYGGIPSSDDPESKLDFDLAYAITTHKSQGSEWPVVVIVLDEAGGRVAGREWIYTAISRASKLCFLVGRLPTAYKMVGRVGLAKRKTFLRELLTTS